MKKKSSVPISSTRFPDAIHDYGGSCRTYMHHESRWEDAVLMHTPGPCRCRAHTLADQHGKLSPVWAEGV
ncbi:hypothetical protein HBI56_034520 [Parastagonospora nodorum]|uniref:Uncharacterized protein n=1 Tax=Phaeosphaeria nodorum (strain SN15 / ATCC MYA-4574 / FGSC 10173) TaxID=321614 RepID=A0A7U2EYU1_PHANO|nr:hypothetical protein HBH56_022320 [Parastagonospora nodorum]QRC95574.1 hypothetical protein JI435_407540 [Parastagonospora nodorum SN15]KAH3937435.1 hypothetical protein HBH54_012160 [Parastagonospora nodorum]KAH3944110.1 hypothetical protein HBH53_164560 [Parastagonospora nodorum]KAH3967470.1 hypothetical protein HBH51_135610 [Parastagonospora nodorum]